MKKRILAMLMAGVMALAFGGCGKEENKKEDSDSSKTEAAREDEKEKDEEEKETEESVSGELFDAGLWTLDYDSEVWSYEEEISYMDEEYTSAFFMIPSGDSYITNIEVRVTLGDQEEFRGYLDLYEFDAYEYVVNDAYDTVDIGGVECLVYEGEYWGEPCLAYFGRMEEASATVFVEILGEYEDDNVNQFLEGLTICVEDIGNVDAPWPWDGEAFSTSDASGLIGDCTVDSQWIPIEDCIISNETFNHDVAYVNDKVYILGDDTLKQYAYDGTSLTYEGEVVCGEDYQYVQATNDGTVWVSGFGAPLMCLKDGVETATYEGVDYITMHPSGEWGINWFSGPDCEKVTFADGSDSRTAMSFGEVGTISSLIVDENYIYVCGDSTDGTGHKVYVYDTNGVLQMTLADMDGECLGCITFMCQTADGFLGLDGNLREVVHWSNDGTCLGVIDGGDLFGTIYPWYCGGTMLDDGSIMVVMTDERADESAMEVIAFRLSGF